MRLSSRVDLTARLLFHRAGPSELEDRGLWLPVCARTFSVLCVAVPQTLLFGVAGWRVGVEPQGFCGCEHSSESADAQREKLRPTVPGLDSKSSALPWRAPGTLRSALRPDCSPNCLPSFGSWLSGTGLC